MNKQKISFAVLFLTAAVSFAQTDKREQVVTTVSDNTPKQEISIESEEWFESGAWRNDHDLSKLFFDIQESVRKSMPVDPSILEASSALRTKFNAAMVAKGKELGATVVVSEDGNSMSVSDITDKNAWEAATKSIRTEYESANTLLYENWRKEFEIRFEKAFVEAAKNLKMNADKMK
ncbi:MAG TPA: hypothetical protein VHP36_04580 [Chitinispirillaceae bacterium]|nr:hypothetical protein [Chitinispirillaceae bacterium]